MKKQEIQHKRVLLKLSGEALQGKSSYGISEDACTATALSIKDLIDNGIEVGIVIGGGNIFRYRSAAEQKLSIARTPADQMGMLATIINGIALREACERIGLQSVVMSAIDCHQFVEPYSWQKAIHHLNEKRVVIFVAGTGSPYFTTDTAAALRASEIKADILLKATKVDGIYTKDPHRYTDAELFKEIRFSEALAKDLHIMDATAFALCMSNAIPILVFNMSSGKPLSSILKNKDCGTYVY